MNYSKTAIALHWLTALLILAAFPLGFYMVGLPLSPAKLQFYSWHKWLGVTVFLLAVLRLLWRWRHPAPPLPDSLAAWEKHLAGATHILLYLLMLAIPLTGWLMSSAAGFQVVYLGVLPIPDLIGKDRALADCLKWVHQFATTTLGLFVLAHIGAALKHQFISRDAVLSRMLPFLRKPS